MKELLMIGFCNICLFSYLGLKELNYKRIINFLDEQKIEYIKKPGKEIRIYTTFRDQNFCERGNFEVLEVGLLTTTIGIINDTKIVNYKVNALIDFLEEKKINYKIENKNLCVELEKNEIVPKKIIRVYKLNVTSEFLLEQTAEKVINFLEER